MAAHALDLRRCHQLAQRSRGQWMRWLLLLRNLQWFCFLYISVMLLSFHSFHSFLTLHTEEGWDRGWCCPTQMMVLHKRRAFSLPNCIWVNATDWRNSTKSDKKRGDVLICTRSSSQIWAHNSKCGCPQQPRRDLEAVTFNADWTLKCTFCPELVNYSIKGQKINWQQLWWWIVQVIF